MNSIRLISVFVLFFLANNNNFVQSIMETRVMNNLACNCMLNVYAHKEMLLGLQYLDKSNIASHDYVAYYGFSKLFDKYWSEHLQNINKIYKYIVKRGGNVVMLSADSFEKIKKFNYKHVTHEISVVVKDFWRNERELNAYLLRLSKCVGDADGDVQKQLEAECETEFYNVDADFHQSAYGIDPVSSNFLDDHLLPQRVERIKYLSDLYNRITRFDHFQNITRPQIVVNPYGLYLIDKELQ